MYKRKIIESINGIRIKINVMIGIYICQNYTKSIILSIQNKNIFETEMRLINDNSKDNSLKIILKL